MEELIARIKGLKDAVMSHDVTGIIKGAGQLLVIVGDSLGPLFGHVHVSELSALKATVTEPKMVVLDNELQALQVACDGFTKEKPTLPGAGGDISSAVVFDIIMKITDLITEIRGLIKPKPQPAPQATESAPKSSKKKA